MEDLKQKIYDIGATLQMTSCATVTEDGKPWVRNVMGKIDNELTYRFCTHLGSRKVKQIENNNSVHVLLGVNEVEKAQNWIQFSGVAEVTTDKEERHTFWYDMLEHIFSGPDDPNYCVVKVKPTQIELHSMASMTPLVWEP
jgi:general stress protein 26